MITTSNFSICYFVILEDVEQSSRPKRRRNAALVLKIQWKLFRILDAILHFNQKSDGFFPIDRAVIVTEGQVHHRANFNFSVCGDWSWHDLVHAEDAALRRI